LLRSRGFARGHDRRVFEARQPDIECGAVAESCRLHFDAAAVAFDQLLGQCQANAESALAAQCATGRLPEHFEGDSPFICHLWTPPRLQALFCKNTDVAFIYSACG
jgi:hypothetical protein